MDFDSPDPDVEKEFPGLYGSDSVGSRKREEEDFSEGDHEKVSKKEILLGRRKDKKDKKDKGYAALDGESSPEEELDPKSPSKSVKKSKAFKFPTKSKEKREKSREKVEVKEKDMSEGKDKKKDKDKEKKEKKEKSKEKEKKDKKSKQSSVSEEILELGDEQPVFGVSLGLSVQRLRCHDDIPLPLVVRDCIDYLQEHGLSNEQIYKVDAVKTKVQQLKTLYNNRETSNTEEFDVPTACGLLKLFFKELPEPILTTDLTTRFEEAAALTQVAQQEFELHNLINQLPTANRTLLSWMLIHLDSVIQNEKLNKMNAHSLAMLLSPTLQMSHRLLVTILCHCKSLFSGTILYKYVPPITSTSPNLPETPDEISTELRKQDSLLNQIHAEMNAGFVTKKREEQLWEVQRIITQLKRKLRTFEKKHDTIHKSLDDTGDVEIQLEMQKQKSTCSDDDSIKVLSIESTEMKCIHQIAAEKAEMKCIHQIAAEKAELTNKRKKSTEHNPSGCQHHNPSGCQHHNPSGCQHHNPSNCHHNPPHCHHNHSHYHHNPDHIYVHDTGLLMVPEDHPEFTTLLRLQLENRELIQWKSTLQSRLLDERHETLILREMLAENNISEFEPDLDEDVVNELLSSPDEEIVSYLLKKNALLEKKKNLLGREIYEQNVELIQLEIELADVENSRSYIDVLYSSDYVEIQDALVTLKNAVIGSNKQKGSVISQGLLPKLISFITQDDVPLNVKLDAAIVIGSLSKGTESHVSALIECRIVDIMLSLITNPSTDRRLVEIALSVLRSIFQHPLAPIVEINTNANFLKEIISLASSDNSIQCQCCVANILVPLCNSFNEQMILCHTGAIPFLARLITTEYTVLQIPALKCLAAMCFTNRTVSDIVCKFNFENKSLPDILTGLLSRVRLSDIQLAAARCLTYIHRSDSLTSTDPRIVYRTLPCLARLCTNDFDEETRATAAETLAYLAEIDSELQRLAAISNHLISSLYDLLKSKTSPLPRVGSFRCFASLGANDEDIRKRIIETKGLMEEMLIGLSDPNPDVRLAAVRCLHSLSRSVQQLRTTFQDHSVWRPLMTLLQGTPSNELLTVVTSTICNLLLEFSPSKEPMVENGCCELLCELTRNPDAALRLNGSWALMNMAFQAEEHIKHKIINTLGTDRIYQLLSDSDSRVIMKTLGLLRNLLSKSLDIEKIMSQHSSQLMKAVGLVLEHPLPEVIEQALCIIGNIAHAAIPTDYIMENEDILIKLLALVTHSDHKLQKAAVIGIKNLIDKNDLNTTNRLMRLNDLGAVDRLETFLSMTAHLSEDVSSIRGLIRRLVGYTQTQ